MSKYLFSFDPGLRLAGFAVFKDNTLIHVETIVSQEAKARGPQAWAAMAEAVEKTLLKWCKELGIDSEKDTIEFVSELMQVYVIKGYMRADPDDLLQLTGVSGFVASLFPGPHFGYYPREWKKNVPKEIHQRWIKKRLTKEERQILDVEFADHNGVDAVGIGLYHNYRLRRRAWGSKYEETQVAEEETMQNRKSYPLDKME